MKKYLKSVIGVAIIIFLTVNVYLIYNAKSVIPKSIYVKTYERMTVNDFSLKQEKEGLVAPQEMYTIYVGNEDEVDSWIVTEGDTVQVGDELVLLNMERSESQNSIWESERDLLIQQEAELERMITSLESARDAANNNSSSNSTQNEYKDEDTGNITIEVDMNVQVDVSQDGSYAQAIATVEQELVDVNRRLVVAEALLAQNSARPAIVSPVDGIVSNVMRLGPTRAIEIYSLEKVIVTYAKENEWKEIQEAAQVLIHESETEEPIVGTVASISSLPAGGSSWLEAYQALDPEQVKNPLAYYEVQISTESELGQMPFGNHISTEIIIDEAKEAVSVKRNWMKEETDASVTGFLIDDLGRISKATITTPFDWNTRMVVSEGFKLGDVVIDGQAVTDSEYPRRVVLPMPSHLPTKGEWKSFGKKNFLKYMIFK